MIKPEESSSFKALVEKAKSYYVTKVTIIFFIFLFLIKIKKYDPEQLTVCTLVFEGSKTEVTL